MCFLQANQLQSWTVAVSSISVHLANIVMWLAKLTVTLAIVDPKYSASVLAVQGLFALLSKMTVPLLSRWVTTGLDNDWDSLLTYLGYACCAAVIFPVIVLAWYFLKGRN